VEQEEEVVAAYLIFKLGALESDFLNLEWFWPDGSILISFLPSGYGN
jgi:hypothetical protein